MTEEFLKGWKINKNSFKGFKWLMGLKRFSFGATATQAAGFHVCQSPGNSS